MIKIDNIKKSFNNNCAVDIDSLTINDGELVGLVGNNGAGKTTLFRLMTDLLLSDEGSIYFDNIDVHKSENWKEFTSAYIDESFLVDFLTPSEYFHFIGKICGFNEEETNKRIDEIKYVFEEENILNEKKLIRNFSAGNKQKVGIAAAMIRRPKYLILDEPFNYIDPTSQEIIKQLLLKFRKDYGTTIIISSHNIEHTVNICTRVLLMEKGAIIKDIDNDFGEAINILKDYFFSHIE